MRSRLAAAVLAVAAAVTVGACSDHGGTAGKPGTCLDGLSAPAAHAGPSSAAGASGAGPGRLPDLVLACFDGSGDVRLDTLGRPAVVSLWASWCAPCRDELPQLESYARSAGDTVAVIGVDTLDDRTHAGSMISDDHLGYPMLFDPDKRLADAIGHTVLPVTLFVAPGGVIRHVYFGGTAPIDEATLTRLAAQYLGVRSPG